MQEEELTPAAIRAIKAVKRLTGVDASVYKPNLIERRLRVRAADNKCGSIESYVDRLETDETLGRSEAELIVASLSVPVSGFFRDPWIFDSLEKAVYPDLFINQKTLAARRGANIWSLGCSRGQEAYSLAVSMFRYKEAVGSSAKISIFATDVDANALKIAESGHYLERSLSGIPKSFLRQYFEKSSEGGWDVDRKIRKLVRFKQSNAFDFSSHPKDVDLILCRNMLIYLTVQAQEALLKALWDDLRPGGFLVLGSSETILGKTGRLFASVASMRNAYQKPA